MLAWLSANLATILISAVLLVLLAFAVRYLVKARKNGGCAGCPGCGGENCCHCSQQSCSSHTGNKQPL